MSSWSSLTPHPQSVGTQAGAASDADDTVSRVTVITSETHASVCVGCGAVIVLGDLYCERCALGHELREAWRDAAA